ncbi:hypothetical protein HGRIS_010910 [Hohenbuehelia grisea]
MLRYPIFTTKDLRCVVPHLADINLTILSRLKTQGRYSAHVFSQEADLRIFMEDESLILDPLMDRNATTGLISEVCKRPFTVCPTTVVSFC